MRWGDEFKALHKAFRPKPDSVIRIDRRLLHPAEQEEIERRVELYAKQVEEQGYVSFLPRRGSGRSASVEALESDESVMDDAAESERVLPGPRLRSPSAGTIPL